MADDDPYGSAQFSGTWATGTTHRSIPIRRFWLRRRPCILAFTAGATVTLAALGVTLKYWGS